jgi:peptidoglycan/LPS O-acetylase OafA/YrhL
MATERSSRLHGLDGIRGLAALYVVLNHTYLPSFPGYPVATGPWWTAWMIYGRFAVDIFIVLSGFSLAVVPVRTGWRLPSKAEFARRRAWRILPPYWAALIFSLLVAWLVVPQPGNGVPNGWSVLDYGLLLQDASNEPSPNRAFWTIAIEAQLYVVFPLLLLLVRRAGAMAMLASVAIVVGTIGVLAPVFGWADTLVIRDAPDLAVLFATGVVASGIVTASPRIRAWPWPWFALAAATPVAVTMVAAGTVWTLNHLFWIDLALAPAIGCLLAAVATDRPTLLIPVLDSGPLRRLGSFSYSLYLVHAPIVSLVYREIVAGRVPRGAPSFLLALAFVLPLTIGFAWLFASIFELPFQRSRGLPESIRRIVHIGSDIGEKRFPRTNG